MHLIPFSVPEVYTAIILFLLLLSWPVTTASWILTQALENKDQSQESQTCQCYALAVTQNCTAINRWIC